MKHTTQRTLFMLAALARLDERRRKLGMQPIAEYAKQLAELYKMPLVESSLPHAPAHK